MGEVYEVARWAGVDDGGWRTEDHEGEPERFAALAEAEARYAELSGWPRERYAEALGRWCDADARRGTFRLSLSRVEVDGDGRELGSIDLDGEEYAWADWQRDREEEK